MNRLKEHFIDFTHLAFPFRCCGCQSALDRDEDLICNDCLMHLPLTEYSSIRNNTVEKLFWGKLPVRYAAAYCYFTAGGVVQSLVHALKYKGKTKVGSILGHAYALELRKTVFQEADLVVPVPLHASRKKTRGYNQCDFIAQGLAFGMNLPYDVKVLSRLRANESQTRKGVFERWINVKELFKVERPELIEGKHVLLVDDVITTGATTEACAGAVLTVPNTTVSVVTLACPAVV